MTVREQRCRQCGAAARPGAPWCTQCYAPLGEQPQPPAPQPCAPQPCAPPPVATTPAATSTASWPCTACGAGNDLSRDDCAHCGVPFLAGARSSEPLLHLPVVGDLTVMSKARRTWLALALVACFVVVSALLALLLA